MQASRYRPFIPLSEQLAQTNTKTQSLTSRGAARRVRRCPAPVQNFTVVQTWCLQSRAGHRAVGDDPEARCLLPLPGESPSARRTQQILNVKRRTSRRRSQLLRSRRFIIKHVYFFCHSPGVVCFLLFFKKDLIKKKIPNLDVSMKSFPGMRLVVRPGVSSPLPRVNHPGAARVRAQTGSEIQREVSRSKRRRVTPRR